VHDELNLAGGVLVLIAAIGNCGRLSLAVYGASDAPGAGAPIGHPVSRITQPGLHFKWPFIEDVIYIDNRILDIESPAQEVIASDQKRLVVDAFARTKLPMRCCSIKPSGRSRAAMRGF